MADGEVGVEKRGKAVKKDTDEGRTWCDRKPVAKRHHEVSGTLALPL